MLSLDATVVLLTPVVLSTATRIGARPKPHLYACTHLANSASLLLPASNLTNLLAFAASGLTFAGFAGVMVLPWLAVVTTEYVIFRLFFAVDLSGASRGTGVPAPAATRAPPRFALSVLAATLLGFGLAAPAGVPPAWVAAAGAAVLAAPRLARHPCSEPVVTGTLAAGQRALLDAALARLGRPARREGRHGHLPREVVAACAGAGLLVLARDGDHSRLGPRSIAHATRFVVDHAPCRVLLIWPDEPPDIATLPPPPPPGHGPPPPGHGPPPPGHGPPPPGRRPSAP